MADQDKPSETKPLPTLSFSVLGPLTPLELRRKITTKQAAELNGICEDAFKQNYPHLIKKIGPRRNGVELADAINLPPAETVRRGHSRTRAG